MTFHDLSFCPKTCFRLWQTHHHWTEISMPFRMHRRVLAICAFITRPGENVHASVWGGHLGNSCHVFPFSFKTKVNHTPKCAHTHSHAHTSSLSICFYRLLITVNISTENTIKQKTIQKNNSIKSFLISEGLEFELMPLQRGWEIHFPKGPHEKFGQLQRAEPIHLTKFCPIYLISLNKWDIYNHTMKLCSTQLYQ